jgi:hypothetical protein
MCEQMKMVKASSILYSEMGGGERGGGSGSIVSNNEKYSPFVA